MIIGVTGSFGSGKTTVARMFKSCGAKIIDADRLAHRLIRPKTKVYQKIIAAFGGGVLKRDKTIDRDKLAARVFNNRKLLSRLNNIVHPEVIRIIKGRIKNAEAGIIILDAPLLIEAGLGAWVDKLIVVEIAKRKQIERIQKRNHLNQKEISRRIGLQMPLKDKVRLADFVIDNNGTQKEARKQVDKIRRQLWKS